MIWNSKTRATAKFFGLLMALNTVSCANVKPYQRAYLDDRDMKFKQNKAEGFENYSHSIREGAAGGGMGKSSGGCGCN